MDMAEVGEDLENIGLEDFAKMLEAGLEGLCGIVDARVGDKTLVDTHSPSVDALKDGINSGISFKDALENMKAARIKDAILQKIWLPSLGVPVVWENALAEC